MKKILQISLIFLIAISVSSCGKKKVEKKEDNFSQPIDEMVKNETITKQGDIELSNIKITSNGSMNIVTAIIKNTGLSKKTFNAVLYMKNENGLILGKIEQNIKDLKSKESREISVEIMGDYTTVNTYELIVEGLLEE